MTTCLGKSCSFGYTCVSFVNVYPCVCVCVCVSVCVCVYVCVLLSLLVLRVGYKI